MTKHEIAKLILSLGFLVFGVAGILFLNELFEELKLKFKKKDPSSGTYKVPKGTHYVRVTMLGGGGGGSGSGPLHVEEIYTDDKPKKFVYDPFLKKMRLVPIQDHPVISKKKRKTVKKKKSVHKKK